MYSENFQMLINFKRYKKHLHNDNDDDKILKSQFDLKQHQLLNKCIVGLKISLEKQIMKKCTSALISIKVTHSLIKTMNIYQIPHNSSCFNKRP